MDPYLLNTVLLCFVIGFPDSEREEQVTVSLRDRTDRTEYAGRTDYNIHQGDL